MVTSCSQVPEESCHDVMDVKCEDVTRVLSRTEQHEVAGGQMLFLGRHFPNVFK